LISERFKQRLYIRIKRVLERTLYTRLVILLLCIAFSTVLMQAGSLFLLDYIPTINDVIHKIRQQELIWGHRIEVYRNAQKNGLLIEMTFPHEDFIKTTDPHLSWLKHQNDKLILNSLNNVENAHQTFETIIHGRATTAMKVDAAEALASSYKNLGDVLERDVEIKQSVVSLLQMVSMLLILSCIGAIALGGRRILVDRLDHLLTFAPPEYVKNIQLSATDEFSQLERMVYEIASRLEGFKAETQWVNQACGERIRRMVQSQDFLFKFIEMINNNLLGEMTIRKMLYSLEKVLDANNVSLIFTDNDTLASERVLFSHHWPALLDRKMIEDVEDATSIHFIASSAEGVNTHCLAVAFPSARGEFGILKIEADENRVFEESEKQLVEVTAQLLSMVMGFQGREQEGRRVALLEERAAIARELHDSLAQSLSYMKIQIARLQSGLTQASSLDSYHEIVNELREGLDSAYKELRELLTTFRVHMDVRGLGSAIQTAIDEFSQRSSLSISLDNRLINCRLTVNEEFHILHVVREALSNIVRHAGANNVMISLVFQQNGTVMVTIDDDGIGYTANREDEPHHYGQAIMKERAFSLGGDFQILARRKGGTRVRLVFTPKLAQ
jgi:two-component system nitrate/nitrite sensor histidine kinase NarX